MPQSIVDQKTDLIQKLLWDNILRELIDVTLPGINPVFAWKPVRNTVEFLIDEYIALPLFEIMARWGVFTSIEWGGLEIYRKYEEQAAKLLPVQNQDTWPTKDREEFRNAARALIHFNIRPISLDT